MPDPQARKQKVSAAWTVLGATAFLALLIGVGSALSEAQDDRAAAPLLLAVMALGLIAATLVRLRPRFMSFIAAALAALQTVVMIVMLVQGIGTPEIVVFIHVLLVSGWAAAAWMFWGTTRE